MNAHEFLERKGADKQIVFCQRCKKKELLQQPPPRGVTLETDKDALTILLGTPRRQVAWMGWSALVLFVTSLLLWMHPDPSLTMAAIITTVLALLLAILAVLLPSQAKIKIRLNPAGSAGEPFREGASPSDYSIEIYLSMVFSKREFVLLESIQQVYCSRERRADLNGYTSYVYCVEAILKRGPTVPLMKEILLLPTAQYIEAKLEDFLELDDVPVSKEAKA
jgi:hypothetical protein